MAKVKSKRATPTQRTIRKVPKSARNPSWWSRATKKGS